MKPLALVWSNILSVWEGMCFVSKQSSWNIPADDKVNRSSKKDKTWFTNNGNWLDIKLPNLRRGVFAFVT